jgi:hypothetical protein
MNKCIHALAATVISLVVVSTAHAAGLQGSKPMELRATTSVAVDAVATGGDATRTAGMVKTSSRSYPADATNTSATETPVLDETTGVDAITVLAGLGLVIFIAIRRIRA